MRCVTPPNSSSKAVGSPLKLRGALRHPQQARCHGGVLTYRGILLRFSMGLEDVRDLQADMAQALDGLKI